MGNICGCVRADKDEQCLDPARAPLSPAKHSPGRKYFRRKSRRKQAEDEREPEKIKENEGKIQFKANRSKETATATHPRELAIHESVIQKALLDRTDLTVSTDVNADLVKAKLVSGASCDSSSGNGACAKGRRASKSEEKERLLTEDLEKCPKKRKPSCSTQDKKSSHNGIQGEFTFQKNRGVNFEKESGSNCVLNKQFEENALSKALSGIADDSPKWENGYNRHPAKLQNQTHLQQGFPKSVSLPLSQENEAHSILPNRSKVNIL